MPAVTFRYLTGLKPPLFRNARLTGSWDGAGRYSSAWSTAAMTADTAEDGCPCFTVTVTLDAHAVGSTFQWGVTLDGPGGANLWGVPTEIGDMNSTARYRSFVLSAATAQLQDFYFTYARRLGARPRFTRGGAAPGLGFAVWAPNAQAVDVVFGKTDNGYVSDDGTGIDASRPALALSRDGDGIWRSATVPDFAAFENVPYLYRVRTAQGQTVYRTDLSSRSQIGRGSTDPGGGHYAGTPAVLDGSKGCSLIQDVDLVARDFGQAGGVRITAAEFWANEFDPSHIVPSRVEDLVVYELHVNALGAGKNRPGNLQDAIDLLPYLGDLGVNAVELMPMCEFSGGYGWGYGDSHHFCIESGAGGRDEYKHFVRACHQRGIAVIQDVCYNHFDYNAARDEWQYDSTAPEQNSYYWYEGTSADYPGNPTGGYVDNGSSGFAPRYWEEVVRHVFISSAAMLVEEFHVDGLRVDLTQALHRDNCLHADGRSLGNANLFGQKLLREWSRTLRMIRPEVMLSAEDHTGWDAVTQSPDVGGLGFDVTWFAQFYHDLIGDADGAGGRARLLKSAGFGGDDPLAMEQFAGTLYQSQYGKVVFHKSHDEAGNDPGTMRNVVCAVNGAPLVGVTRAYAEARCRVITALSLLSAGTPMFFMGEEVGAAKPYRYTDFLANREDLAAERAGDGARLFRYYQDLIHFCGAHPVTRSHAIDIIHVIGANRLLAFTRRSGSEQILVVASLRNQPFTDGYVIQTDASRLPDGLWREVFNSDAGAYGGADVGNFGAAVPVSGGRIQVRVPANGVLVFQKV